MAGNRQLYVNFLVQDANYNALLAGNVGSTAYNTSINSTIGTLYGYITTLKAKIIAQDGGKLAASVNIPGQNVAFAPDLTIIETAQAIQEAIGILQGTNTIVRRTTNRYY